MKYLKENKKSWKVYRHPKTKDWLDYNGYENLEGSENFVFEATLIPAGSYRGRSAAGFTFLDADDGSEFTMRIAKAEEFFRAIASGKVKIEKNATQTKIQYSETETYKGGFKAKFTFFKQGANYSIGLAGDEE
jgi:hypothetical protein